MSLEHSLDRDMNTVVLNGHYADIHLWCTWEEAWGSMLVCASRLVLSLCVHCTAPPTSVDVEQEEEEEQEGVLNKLHIKLQESH